MLAARTFFVVSGANRGLGKQIALDFAAQLSQASTVLLIGRSEADLEPVAEALRSAGSQRVLIFSADLKEYDPLAHRAFLSRNVPDPSAYEQCVLINNAGTLSNVQHLCLDNVSMPEINEYLSINVTSAISLTSVVLKYFERVPKRVVVNITSKASSWAMKSASLYCTVKAARETYFRVLAAEYPDIRVLNYAPGPVDTAMFHQAKASADPDIKQYFCTTKPLAPEVTVERLMTLLREDKYKSGETIDFFDNV